MALLPQIPTPVFDIANQMVVGTHGNHELIHLGV
jgi:hypothetical protein